MAATRPSECSAEDCLAQIEAASARDHVNNAFDLLPLLNEAIKGGKRKHIRRAMRFLENALVMAELKLGEAEAIPVSISASISACAVEPALQPHVMLVPSVAAPEGYAAAEASEEATPLRLVHSRRRAGRS